MFKRDRGGDSTRQPKVTFNTMEPTSAVRMLTPERESTLARQFSDPDHSWHKEYNDHTAWAAKEYKSGAMAKDFAADAQREINSKMEK